MKRYFRLLLVVFTLSACGPHAKDRARTADDVLRKACETLAAQQAEELGISVEDIIKVTCTAENLTRDWRDQLLSLQRAELVKAGLAAE